MLKELLGELYTPEIAAKVGDKKLVVNNDGSWIPREKFNTATTEVGQLKDQLKERDTQMTELKKAATGNEALQTQIQTLTEANKQTQLDYDNKLKQANFDFAVERALVASKAKKPKAVKALLDLTKVQLNGETLIGLDDQLKTIRESDAYLFGEPGPIGDGSNPAGGGGGNQSKSSMNDFIRASAGVQI